MSIKNLSIGKKIYVLASLLVLIFTLCIVWLVFTLNDRVHETAEKKLSAAVDTSWGIIDYYSRQAGSALTEEQAQSAAKEAIRNLRHSSNDYFWINDTLPRMIMHPAKPELEGKDMSNTKDPDGLFVFQEFVKAASGQGNGYAYYQWPKPGEEQPQPKVAYLKNIRNGIGSSAAASTSMIWKRDQPYHLHSRSYYFSCNNRFRVCGLPVVQIDYQSNQKAVNMIGELEKGHLSERLNLDQQDEIGMMAKSMDAFANSLQNEVIGSLQKLADGNLDLNVVPRDAQDEVRGALNKLENDLNNVMASIQTAGNQISAGSVNVSDFSQSLSQGATESAASLEEISSSLNQMSGQTKLNADNANQVNSLSTEAKQATEQGKIMMERMVAAMEDIREAGQNINKIIKVIDEIAFKPICWH